MPINRFSPAPTSRQLHNLFRKGGLRGTDHHFKNYSPVSVCQQRKCFYRGIYSSFGVEGGWFSLWILTAFPPFAPTLSTSLQSRKRLGYVEVEVSTASYTENYYGFMSSLGLLAVLNYHPPASVYTFPLSITSLNFQRSSESHFWVLLGYRPIERRFLT